MQINDLHMSDTSTRHVTEVLVFNDDADSVLFTGDA